MSVTHGISLYLTITHGTFICQQEEVKASSLRCRPLYTDHGSRHNKRANQTNEEEILCSLRRIPPLIVYRQLSSHAYDVAVLQISICGFFLRLIYH